MLQPNTIKSAKGSRKKTKRLGRGNASGVGTYSGRGGKGQTARSGGRGGLKMKGFKRLMQSTPKLRGFNSLNKKITEVRSGDLEKYYNQNEIVNIKSLKEKNLIGKNIVEVKVILKGDLKKKLIIEGLKLTKGSKDIIEKAGGEIK